MLKYVLGGVTLATTGYGLKKNISIVKKVFLKKRNFTK